MKQRKFLLLALAALLLTGCSLAQAEADGARDRWAGFYVVPTQGYESGFYDNPYLEEYGTASADSEFGTLVFPQEVLFAVEDEAGNYTFPGLEKGFSLFRVLKTEEYGLVDEFVSNMAPDEEVNTTVVNDEGTSYTFSGTVYYGPPADAADWWEANLDDATVWHCYDVYQTEDGRVYLTGSGNSFNGLGSMTQTRTWTQRENGETVQKETVKVTVNVESTERLERLAAIQFDENNAILQSEDLSLQNDRPELHCLADTAWVLVEETGPEGTKRTLYDVPEGEDPVSHMFVLLDDEGCGFPAYLNIYAK